MDEGNVTTLSDVQLQSRICSCIITALLPQAVIEQEDFPTDGRKRSEECPIAGPLIVPAKQVANPAHAHALLAPDFSFDMWIEVCISQ